MPAITGNAIVGAHGEERVSYVPYVALFSTAVGITIRLIARSQRAKPPPYGSEPNTGPSLGDQTIGEPCVLCEKSIMLEADGTRCRTCKAIVHKRCAKDHGAIHKKRPAPYR
jgi:hypothetical protein